MTVEDPIEFLHGHKKCIVNQREVGSDAAVLRARPEGRAAPGPRRDPRRRDARPRDDLDRADRGRDRPPRLRHAAHAERAADDRPHHRRLPGPPAGPGPRAALGRAHGRHDPAAAARPPTARAASWPARCSCPTPAVRNLIREGKTHQIPSAMQTGSSVGMQTMDAALATPRPRRQDHPAPRRAALLDARGAAPPARLRQRRWSPPELAWPPTSSRRWTSPGRRPPARSRPTPSRSSPTS